MLLLNLFTLIIVVSGTILIVNQIDSSTIIIEDDNDAQTEWGYFDAPYPLNFTGEFHTEHEMRFEEKGRLIIFFRQVILYHTPSDWVYLTVKEGGDNILEEAFETDIFGRYIEVPVDRQGFYYIDIIYGDGTVGLNFIFIPDAMIEAIEYTPCLLSFILITIVLASYYQIRLLKGPASEKRSGRFLPWSFSVISVFLAMIAWGHVLSFPFYFFGLMIGLVPLMVFFILVMVGLMTFCIGFGIVGLTYSRSRRLALPGVILGLMTPVFLLVYSLFLRYLFLGWS